MAGIESIHVGEGTARFESTQIESGWGVRGDTGSGVSSIEVQGASTANDIDLSGWTLIDWSPGDGDVINVLGGTGNDTITGTDQADSIFGDTGNDCLLGTDGDDTLVGYDGDDSMYGGSGADSMIGGEGDDEFIYESDNASGDDIDGGNDGSLGDMLVAEASVDFTSASISNVERLEVVNDSTATLSLSQFNVLTDVSGDDATSTTQQFVLVTGTSGSDTIDFSTVTLADWTDGRISWWAWATPWPTPSSARPTPTASAAATATTPCSAAGGNDKFMGGLGDDTIDGDIGDYDAVSYESASAAVTVNLDTGAVSGGDGADSLISIEHAKGSDYSDCLVGSVSAPDGNVFNPGDGSDTIIGNADWTEVSYADASSGVTVNMGYWYQSGTTYHGKSFENGGGDNDSLVGVTDITGSDYADSIVAAPDNGLFVSGGGGTDTIIGGSGYDIVDFRDAASGVSVDLSTQTVSGGSDDSIVGIDGAYGSLYDDTIIGTSSGYTQVRGRAGDDSLVAGSSGGRVDYKWATSGVTVDLSTERATGGAGNDTIVGFTDVRGSKLYADSLVGDSGNNLFRPWGGSDTVVGNGGNDRVDYRDLETGITVDLGYYDQGGGVYHGKSFKDSDGDSSVDAYDSLVGIKYVYGTSGADSLMGSPNDDDVLMGRAGSDYLVGEGGGVYTTASYMDDSGGVTVNLAGGTATDGWGDTDNLTNITDVWGSSYDDSLVGDAGDNYFQGGAGNDTIDGGAGTDDIASWGDATGGVSVDLSANSATGWGTDSLVGIERAYGSYYADTLVGDANDNQLRGRTGDDSLVGGSGFDKADYRKATGSVTVDLSTERAYGADGNDTLVGMEGVRGSEYADSLVGDGQDNYLEGNAGADTMVGGAGEDYLGGDEDADSLTGGAGDDCLVGGAGDDTLDGGDDSDTASYADATGAVTVDLSTNTATGADGTDSLVNIENVTGSGYDDCLVGDGVTGSNHFGNMLTGGAGNDTLDGGAGDGDIASYSGAGGSVTVDLGAGSSSGADGTDSLVNIEGVVGSSYADTLSAGTSGGYLEGGGGNDSLYGEGWNTVNGQEQGTMASYWHATGSVTVDLGAGSSSGADGADVLTGIVGAFGSSHDDSLYGSNTASNMLMGNEGNDTLVGFGRANGLWTEASYEFASGSVVVDLTANQATGADGTDSLTGITDIQGSDFADTLIGSTAWSTWFSGGTGDDSIVGQASQDRDEVSYDMASSGVTVDLSAGTASGGDGNDILVSIENADGSEYDDSIVGSAEVNYLRGNAGNDSISGGDGGDTVDGGAGDDTLEGGLGNDWLNYSHAGAGVTVDLGTTGSAQNTVGDGTDWLADSFEYVNGSDYADSLVGDVNANWIMGGEGDDTLLGGDGNDTIDGGEGNDTMTAGSGEDWLNYAGAVSGVTLNLGITGTDQATGGGGTDFLADSFENVFGSGFDDSLVGDTADNEMWGKVGVDELHGGDGADKLYGDEGADSLFGDLGDDWLTGGDGNDTLDGGTGEDWANYHGYADNGITVNLATPYFYSVDQVDSLYGIEHIAGSMQADSLVGSTGANSLMGYEGVDELYGGDGNDELHGGDDNDVLDGGTGNDLLFGDDGADNVSGGDGDDTICGGAGADVLDGGNDTDVLDYSDLSSSGTAGYQGVVVDLSGTATDPWNSTDTVSNFEAVKGTGFNDSIAGYTGNDSLWGMAGDDTLAGSDGADTLDGGSGADVYHYGATSDWSGTTNDPSGMDHLIFSTSDGDKLHFSSSFNGMDANSDYVLDADKFEFVSGFDGSNGAISSQCLVFDTSTHQLYYDSNGSDTSGGNYLVADFSLGDDLSANTDVGIG